MTVTELIEHIESVHHVYVREASPRIAQQLAKEPTLREAAALFDEVREELAQHMFKEERILFPYIRDLAAREDGCGATQSPFGTIENPIRMMEHEHDRAKAALVRVRDLTRGSGTTADAVDAFERDLHEHVHLENDVLFPAAVKLEESCLAATMRTGPRR